VKTKQGCSHQAAGGGGRSAVSAGSTEAFSATRIPHPNEARLTCRR
jgi:hypothetical protein